MGEKGFNSLVMTREDGLCGLKRGIAGKANKLTTTVVKIKPLLATDSEASRPKGRMLRLWQKLDEEGPMVGTKSTGR